MRNTAEKDRDIFITEMMNANDEEIGSYCRVSVSTVRYHESQGTLGELIAKSYDKRADTYKNME